jgi:biotin synthase
VTDDILDEARSQVLNGGAGLDTGQVLRVLRLPDDRLDEALSLAHEVRMRWCGPKVEVEGIVSVKTGGCPEDCHFCSQSGRFVSAVRTVGLDSAAGRGAVDRSVPAGAAARRPALCGGTRADPR